MNDQTTAVTASPPSMGSVLRAELLKTRSSSSLRIILLVALGISVGLTAVATLGGGADALFETQTAGDPGSPYEILFFGPSLGVWAYAFFAAHFVAGEFSSGMITYSFAATPSRSRLLLAKLLIVAVLGFVAGLAISLINFGITQGMLQMAGYPALSLTDPDLLQVITVFIPVQMTVWGVIVLLLAAVVRSTAPTVIGVFLVSLLPVTLAPMLPGIWGENVPRWMPGALTESVAGLAVPGTAGYQPLGIAVPMLIAWCAVIGSVVLPIFNRRDV